MTNAKKRKAPIENDSIRIGLALSGGGVRAIAFHLGCMRELNRRGLLKHVSVISAVSGGSVIGALWAYSSVNFDTFDKQVRDLLRRGLVCGIAKSAIFSPEAVRILWSMVRMLLYALFVLVCSVVFILYYVVSMGLFMTCFFRKDKLKTEQMHDPCQSTNTLRKMARKLKLTILRIWTLIKDSVETVNPPIRIASRTTAFARYLDRMYFRGKMLTDVKRNNLQVIINTSELSTRSQFQFDSKLSGSPRIGRLMRTESVAMAVASSAAYPVLLPSVDVERDFINDRGMRFKKRVVLTDGGVYDNLGVHCLIPKCDPLYDFSGANANYIIACSAEVGQPVGNKYPMLWPGRMVEVLSTSLRRNSTATYSLLHMLENCIDIEGFIMPYLGQDDFKIEPRGPDYVTREVSIKP